jgi:hypothetical protein
VCQEIRQNFARKIEGTGATNSHKKQLAASAELLLLIVGAGKIPGRWALVSFDTLSTRFAQNFHILFDNHRIRKSVFHIPDNSL